MSDLALLTGSTMKGLYVVQLFHSDWLKDVNGDLLGLDVASVSMG